MNIKDFKSGTLRQEYQYKRQNETINNKLPDIFVIDATKRESASKRN